MNRNDTDHTEPVASAEPALDLEHWEARDSGGIDFDDLDEKITR